MKVQYLVYLAIIYLLLVGCSVPYKLNNQFVEDLTDNIVFGKDKKSGLCFAFFSINDKDSTTYSGLGATEVPCNKVEHLINNYN